MKTIEGIIWSEGRGPSRVSSETDFEIEGANYTTIIGPTFEAYEAALSFADKREGEVMTVGQIVEDRLKVNAESPIWQNSWTTATSELVFVDERGVLYPDGTPTIITTNLDCFAIHSRGNKTHDRFGYLEIDYKTLGPKIMNGTYEPATHSQPRSLNRCAQLISVNEIHSHKDVNNFLDDILTQIRINCVANTPKIREEYFRKAMDYQVGKEFIHVQPYFPVSTDPGLTVTVKPQMTFLRITNSRLACISFHNTPSNARFLVRW